MTWKEWIKDHATLFGLLQVEEADMLAALANLYHERGLTPEDLLAVSHWLTQNDPPVFRTDHIAALDRGIRALAPREAADRPAEAGCLLCGDATTATGIVLVPRESAADRAAQRTWAVWCKCPLGRWRAKNAPLVLAKGGRKRAKVLTLAEYEEQVPDWRETLASWKRAVRHEAEALSQARSLDKLIGQIGRMPRQ